ncbi:MAG: hypothetical protein JXQ69_04765 [Paludibacteraceae bacterium]|nr:hypothetical protein [Paludibacteraceae bacterium]MBN2787620.1 hypothetical protein [Paludibacteraceae bacterium]
MNTQKITILLISLIICGIVKSQSEDSLSLKLVVSTDLFAKESKLLIKNNHSTPITMRFYIDHSRDLGGPEPHLETFLFLKTLNISTNEVETMDYPLFFENRRVFVIKPDSVFEIPVYLTYQDIDVTKYKILDFYANLLYYTQTELETKDHSRYFGHPVRPIEIELLGTTTPCCTPQPGGTLTVEEAKKKKIVNEEFLSLDGCYDNRLAYGDSANHVDTTKISTLFYLAKNSFNTWSLMLRDQYEIYPNSASLVARYSKYPLKIGVANFKNYYKGLSPSATQSFQTVPLSPYGHYKFTAPSGYDFYSSMKNYYSNYSQLLNEAYFVAYDGSVYCIFISNKNLCNANLHYLNNSFFYSKTLEQLSIRWGFLDGGRMQDEFLDAFIRLYDEGSHFSKEDAYNAAFAYIMEGRGAELYRRAPNETEFKCYNTTPLYEAGSNKISGFNATIK